MGRKSCIAVLAGVAATILVGNGSATAAPPRELGNGASAGAQASVRAQYVPTLGGPQRVLDTRTGGIALGPARAITIELPPAVISAAATAVVLNVTGTSPTAATFVTAYPGNSARPLASTLNLVPGETRANAATIQVGPNNSISFYNNAGSTHLVVDVVGYYAPEGRGLFVPRAPVRLLDTRFTAPVGPATTIVLDVNTIGLRGIGAVLNVTAVGATSDTFITAYSNEMARPPTSSLNASPGPATPNQVTVGFQSQNKQLALYNNAGNVHLVVDLVGYYESAGLYAFFAQPPQRLLDTRVGGGLHGGETGGLCGLPVTMTGVVGNLTATNPTADTFLTAWPGDQPRPLASNLNLVPGQTAANQITSGVGFNQACGQSLNFYNNAGYVDLIFDLAGYFAA